jgi:hypothetical protein
VPADGDGAADAVLGDVERPHRVALVADRDEVTRLAADDQGDQPGGDRRLPRQEPVADVGREPDLGVSQEQHVGLALRCPQPGVVAGQLADRDVQGAAPADELRQPLQHGQLVPPARRQGQESLATIPRVRAQGAPPPLPPGDPRHRQRERLGGVVLLALHGPGFVAADDDRPLADRLGAGHPPAHRLPLGDSAEHIVFEVGDGELGQLVRE